MYEGLGAPLGRGWGATPRAKRVLRRLRLRHDVPLCAMTDQARAVVRQALALTDHERAEVAAELLASLDDPALVQRERTLEIERRARREPSDDAIEWSELRGRVLHRLTSK